MNKFCMFVLFACVASTYANDYAVGQPEYETYSVSVPSHGSGASYGPAPVLEIPSYESPAVIPASYSHASNAQYSSDNAYLPVKTNGNIHGSKIVNAVWESVKPKANSYAQVQKPKAPKGNYQQYAVPGFKIVEIVIEPNYGPGEHVPESAPPAAPAYSHGSVAHVPAAPAYAHSAPAYKPVAPVYVQKPSVYVPAAPAHGPVAEVYAPSVPSYPKAGAKYAIVSSGCNDAKTSSGPTYGPSAEVYVPSHPAHSPSAGSYPPSGPVYVPSAESYAPSGPY